MTGGGLSGNGQSWALRNNCICLQEECMEPDWKTAPSWAQWFTVDDDGYGCWWDTQPVANKMVGCWQVDMSSDWYDTQPAGIYPEAADEWEHSLRQRPAGGGKHDRA
jgi:hypothetical protein